MKRRIDFLAGALTLALLLAGLAAGAVDAQSTPVATPCSATTSCFVFTSAFAAGPSALDLYVDGQLVASKRGLGDASSLISIAPGTHWLQLPAASSAPSAATITASVTFQAGIVADLVLHNASGAPRLNLYPIDVTAPASGLSRSRIVNVWPGLGAVDVELGEPGDKTGGTADATFSNVHENGASGMIESGVFSGSAAVSVYGAGGVDLKAAPPLRPCPAGRVCSYVLIGPAGKDPTVHYGLAIFP